MLKHPTSFIAVLALAICATILLVAAVMKPDIKPGHAPVPEPTPVLPRQLYAEPVAVPAVPQAPQIVVVQGGAFSLGDAPTQWKVCVNEARVYSAPGTNPDWYLYSLYDETPVMVRELDSSRTFAMIQPAEYVRFTELCR